MSSKTDLKSQCEREAEAFVDPDPDGISEEQCAKWDRQRKEYGEPITAEAFSDGARWQWARMQGEIDAARTELEKFKSEMSDYMIQTVNQRAQFIKDNARLSEENARMQGEIDRLMRIIAHEFNENDELGMEYTHVVILKDEIAKLREALKHIVDYVECDVCDANPHSITLDPHLADVARQALTRQSSRGEGG